MISEQSFEEGKGALCSEGSVLQAEGTAGKVRLWKSPWFWLRASMAVAEWSRGGVGVEVREGELMARKGGLGRTWLFLWLRWGAAVVTFNLCCYDSSPGYFACLGSFALSKLKAAMEGAAQLGTQRMVNPEANAAFWHLGLMGRHWDSPNTFSLTSLRLS